MQTPCLLNGTAKDVSSQNRKPHLFPTDTPQKYGFGASAPPSGSLLWSIGPVRTTERIPESGPSFSFFPGLSFFRCSDDPPLSGEISSGGSPSPRPSGFRWVRNRKICV